MDGEEVMISQKTLPGVLVEKIIAMVPFPSIFKARCLSKSWLARFSSIPSLHVEEEKWLATSFQKEVGKWSNNWDTFCPVLYDRVDDNWITNQEEFVAYNRASQNWSRIPSLSFLPHVLFHTDLATRQIQGPLLYGFSLPGTRIHGMEQCCVANVLTRSWRQLPPRPDQDALMTIVYHKLVIDPSCKTYKVILFCAQKGEGVHRFCAQIFDSKLDAWSNKNFKAAIPPLTFFTEGRSTVAYLDGVFYLVSKEIPHILWPFNLEEGNMKRLRLSLNNGDVLRANSVNLVVCNVNCLMLVTSHEEPEGYSVVKVFKIELGERRLVPLTMAPRDCPLDLGFHLLPPEGDGNWILFWKVDVVALPHVGKKYRSPTTCRPQGECSRVMAYNVDKNVWTWFHVPEETTAPGLSEKKYRWFGSSFRPGLSPFLAV